MLAEIDIPVSLWSIKSAFCAVGIVYLIICFILAARSPNGSFIAVVLAVVGLFVLEVATPNPLKAEDGSDLLVHRVYNNDGHSVDLKSLMSVTIPGRMWRPGGDTLNGYHTDHRVFAMHDKSAACLYISPRIFHPACLFWSPAIICILYACVFFSGNKK